MDSKNWQQIKSFNRDLKRELLREFAIYRQYFSQILDDDQTEWPTSYQKRNITLTGRLRDSVSINVTQDRIGFEWNTPYKNKIRFGYVTSKGKKMNGRDWVKLCLSRYPVSTIVKKATVNVTKSKIHFRLSR